MTRHVEHTERLPLQQIAAADLTVGDIVAHRQLHLDAQAFALFSTLTGDTHPIHYDATYAHKQGLAAPVAHGLLLVAISALGATPLSTRLHDAMVAMLGVQAHFHRPVYLNDRVCCTYRIERIDAKRNNRSLVDISVAIEVVDSTHNKQEVPHCLVQLQFLLKTHLEE